MLIGVTYGRAIADAVSDKIAEAAKANPRSVRVSFGLGQPSRQRHMSIRE